MGVMLYYQGTLRTPQDVGDLITEMKDISTANRWKHRIIDDPWDTEVNLKLEHRNGIASFVGNAGLKGIVISPHPESESVWLLFDKNGVLSSLLDMTDPPEKRQPSAFTKTQFAGIDLHIKLVNLLEYVGQKYMREWNLMDDCGYIEHRDREKAEEVFHIIDNAINALTEAFNTVEQSEDLNPDDPNFAEKVEERIKAFLPGAEIRKFEVKDEDE